MPSHFRPLGEGKGPQDSQLRQGVGSRMSLYMDFCDLLIMTQMWLTISARLSLEKAAVREGVSPSRWGCRVKYR